MTAPSRPPERPDGFRCAVLLPSFNSGSQLARTVDAVRDVWPEVLVVVDGSTDGSGACLRDRGVEAIVRAKNGGKGRAVCEGMQCLRDRGFTHAIVMDADGQHAPEAIPEFAALAAQNPAAMILGVPVFGDDAPAERVHGRRVGNFFAELETLWGGIRDSLFGFRLYPLAPALEALRGIRYGRGFDFDTVIAVRLFWAGIRPINRPVPVRYPAREAGGVTHFRYVRDNFLLARTHVRLCLQLLPRIGRVAKLSHQWRSRTEPC